MHCSFFYNTLFWYTSERNRKYQIRIQKTLIKVNTKRGSNVTKIFAEKINRGANFMNFNSKCININQYFNYIMNKIIRNYICNLMFILYVEKYIHMRVIKLIRWSTKFIPNCTQFSFLFLKVFILHFSETI